MCVCLSLPTIFCLFPGWKRPSWSSRWGWRARWRGPARWTGTEGCQRDARRSSECSFFPPVLSPPRVPVTHLQQHVLPLTAHTYSVQSGGVSKCAKLHFFALKKGKMPFQEYKQSIFFAAGACRCLTDSRQPLLLLHMFKQEATQT